MLCGSSNREITNFEARAIKKVYTKEHSSRDRKRHEIEVCELLERIAALRKTAVNAVRDVWRFTRPITAAWNNLNPLRNNPTVQHWGVLVADVDKDTMEKAVSHRKELKKKRKGWGLGAIHELKRVGRQSAYQV